MKRPYLLGRLPETLEGIIYYHWLRPVPKKYERLYERAQLKYAKAIFMGVPRSKEYMYDCIALMGYFEPDLTRRVVRLARPGGLIVDVGANVGYFSLIWLAANGANKCMAIEPSPLILPYLVTNIESNDMVSRAEIRPVAAGPEKGIRQLNLVSEEPTGWAKLAGIDETENVISVEVDSIDNMVGANEVIEFLKIDVEGSEALVLEGCRSLLGNRRIRNVYIEQNEPGAISLGIDNGYSLEILREAGFELRRMATKSQCGIDHWWGTLRTSSVKFGYSM